MATPRSTNPLVSRIREDNIFSGGTQSNLRSAMDQTYANLRGGNGPQTDFGQQNALNNAGIYEPGSFGAQNAAANGTGYAATPEQISSGQGAVGLFSSGVGAPRGGGSSSLNIATGNIFGGGIPAGERAAATGAPVGNQIAGVISGLGDEGAKYAYNSALMQSGINLNPEGQNPADYANGVRAAQNIFGRFYNADGSPKSAGSAGGVGGPVTAYAPTDLRQRAISANGGGVFGQGDVGASFDGMNAQGGRKFSLGQIYPGTGDGQVPNPIAPSAPTPFAASAPKQDTFSRNAKGFQDHIVAQQMAAGLSKGLEPGYMIDPERPNSVKPIPGSLAELNYKKAQVDAAGKAQDSVDAKNAQTEKVRQVTEVAGNVVSNIDSILPKIDSLTAGPVGGVAQHVPGTPGYNVGAILKGVKANLGVQQLQSMRDASKTGASGFGQLSEKELDVVTSTVANLDQAQDPEQLKAGLAKVRDHFNAWKLSYEAGQKAASGTLSPQEQAKTLLAIRRATPKK